MLWNPRLAGLRTRISITCMGVCPRRVSKWSRPAWTERLFSLLSTSATRLYMPLTDSEAGQQGSGNRSTQASILYSEIPASCPSTTRMPSNEAIEHAQDVHFSAEPCTVLHQSRLWRGMRGISCRAKRQSIQNGLRYLLRMICAFQVLGFSFKCDRHMGGKGIPRRCQCVRRVWME